MSHIHDEFSIRVTIVSVVIKKVPWLGQEADGEACHNQAEQGYGAVFDRVSRLLGCDSMQFGKFLVI